MREKKRDKKEQSQKSGITTVRIIALGFFLVILLGAILLWLPFSNETPIAFQDALFTAVSAVCVTGLVTITPATQFTLIGKAILLVLIQIGGLGIIACMVAFFLIIRRKISLKGKIIIQQTYGLNGLSGMVRYIVRILKGTLIVEGIGAVGYSIYFVPRYGHEKGTWYAIFHSISAFCNAGIDIMGDSSFMKMTTSPIVNITTMLLVISGGLGYVVWYDIRKNIKDVYSQGLPKSRLFTRLSLQSKIVLVMTGGLLFIGGIAFLCLEYNNPDTIGTLTFGEKLLASFFQSMTTRTAGFASVSQADLTNGSKLLGCILMLIGGSSGGTAGGVKTTTVALLLLTCVAVIRGKRDVECFGKKIAPAMVHSAVTILFLTLIFWLNGVMAITLLEPQVDFLNILYETTSAIGTVGLTANLTSHLSRSSQVVLMIMMYIGRIGPVTLAMIFAGKVRAAEQIRELPEKHIMIG